MAVANITKDEALTALDLQSWTTEEGQVIVHTFMGNIGADWDLDSARRAVETAQEVAWATNVFGHDLAIRTTDDRIVRFAVRAPEGVLP